jgi:outer membrane protein
MMKIIKYLFVALALLGLSASPALAAEPGTMNLYMGAASVEPDSKILSFEDPFDEEPFSYGVKVGSASSMTLGLTYFMTENWAIDVFAALPFKHDIKGAIIFPDESPIWEKIGSVKQLPPTVSLQYYFTTEGDFDPYIGLGANYTTFSDEKVLDDEGAVDPDVILKLDESFGLAAQVGADWAIGEKWLLNLDVRFVDIETDISLGMVEFMDDIGMVEIGKINIDPWVYSLNLGYHFE